MYLVKSGHHHPIIPDSTMVLHEFSDKNEYTLPHNFISQVHTYDTLYRKISKMLLLDIIEPWALENRHNYISEPH